MKKLVQDILFVLGAIMGIAASVGVAYAVSEFLNLFFGIIYFLMAFEFFFPITMKWMDKAYTLIYKD